MNTIWHAWFRRRRWEQALDSELRFHLEQQIQDHIAAGMNPEEARKRTYLEFGALELAKEECRDQRPISWLYDLVRDIRHALHMLARAPGFTVAVALTLALGIGANTAIFSLVHTVILKPLPYRDPSKLIVAWDTYLPQFPKLGVSPAELEAWQQQTDLFEGSAWYRYVSQDLDLVPPGSEALEVHATFISPDLFPLLGVTPALGHAFAEHEAPTNLLLSRRLWLSRFAGNPAIVGNTVRLGGQGFTIIGVMPADFQFPDWADVWLPQGPLLGDQLTNLVRHALGFVARLRPGATQQQASERLEAIAQRLAAEHPKTSTGFGIRVLGLQEDLTASVRFTLLVMWGAVALVLVIACANVANLLLARADGRAKEIAVRTALGARPGRIVRQLLAENLVLAALGGTLGLALARWSVAGLAPIRTEIDSTVLLFVILVSVATGFAFGLAPALEALHNQPISVIKSRPPGGASMRGVLVVLEFALAFVLLVGANTLVKDFLRLMHVDPGFNPQGLLTLRISLPPSRQPDVLFHRIEERVRSFPGVESVVAANALPLVADRATTTRFNVLGSPFINPDALPAAAIRAVSPDYFHAMQIPLRSGRAFTERDLSNPVVMINESMARRFWPGKDPVGMKFITGPWGPNPSWSTIIGVVGDVKQFGLDSEPSLDLYFPSLAPNYLVIKTAGDPLTLTGAVVREIHAIDLDLPISDVRSMDQVLAYSARSRRWTMGLLGAFAGLALILSLVGVYGVMSWVVAQRTREIGIRIALGAPREQVMRMILRYGIKLSAIGLAIGVAGALALQRLLAGLVFQVSTADPMIYSLTALLMLAAALLACYLPACRATRVDPLVALRWE